MPILTSQTTNPATTVSLSAVFLNSTSDPTDFLALKPISRLQPNTSQAGEVRPMASGGLRLVKQATKPKSYSVGVTLATRAQIDWIEAHVGLVLCIRDDRGRKFFGAYLESPVDESVFSSEYGNVSIQFNEVTYSQAV